MADPQLPVKVEAKADIKADGTRTKSLLRLLDQLHIRISDPEQIVSKAEAKAKAKIIRTTASIQAKELKQRAKARSEANLARQQRNVESIVNESVQLLPAGSEPIAPNDDWMVRFLGCCQDIGDPQLQALWSRILASESSSPGNVSLKTLDIVRCMTKQLAEMFVKLSRFAWEIPEGYRVPIIPSASNGFLRTYNLSYFELCCLAEYGLISDPNGKGTNFKFPTVVRSQSQGTNFTIAAFDPPDRDLPITAIMYTISGVELLRVCQVPQDATVLNATLSHLRSFGLVIQAQNN